LVGYIEVGAFFPSFSHAPSPHPCASPFPLNPAIQFPDHGYNHAVMDKATHPACNIPLQL
jgi:hypothetical protein